MSLRKKKVEAALDKLFSSTKSKSETTQPLSAEAASEAAGVQPAPQIERSSHKATPAPKEEKLPDRGETAVAKNNLSVEEAPREAHPAPLDMIPARADPRSASALDNQPLSPAGAQSPAPAPPSAAVNPPPSVAGQPSVPSLTNDRGDGSAGVERNDGAARRDTASAEVCQLVIFTIAGEAFALPIDRVESIIKPQAITVVPHARPYVVGVTNLRGTVLPVIDLRRRFHLPSAEESEEQRIVVVLFNEEKIGIQVDAVSQVLRIPLSAIEPPPPLVTAFVHSAFVTGIAKVDERLVILLDLEKILLPNHEN